MSISINSRSTATVESRSSHKAMARSVSFEKLRAKARVDCARGPSLASMLMGRPSTKPTALRSRATARRRAASDLKALRWMVSTPVASLRSGSDTATPMVLVPKSRPTSAPRSGQCAVASIRGKITAGMAPHTTRPAMGAKWERLITMDRLTLFGLFAVPAMLACYALEDRSHWFVLAFAGACALGSIYGFLQGAWPFGLVEAVWAGVALWRWAVRRPSKM